MLLQSLAHDLLQQVLLVCDFDTLCALLASCQQLYELVPSIMQARAWRTKDENEHALQRSAWEHDIHVESCLGAFADDDTACHGPMSVPL